MYVEGSRTTRFVIIGLIVCGVGGMWATNASRPALAQQTGQPPLPPPLREERRTPTEILFVSDPDCPVTVSGTIALGQTTSGTGSLVVKNIGTKSIAAINGRLIYDSTGEPISYPWGQNFLVSLAVARRYFPPGGQISVPLVPLNVTTGNERISRVLAKVTGVLFADGTIWGEAGETLRKKFLDEAAAARLKLRQVLLASEKMSAPALEKFISTDPIRDGSRWVNLALRMGLLDDKGHLHPDARERIKRMIANLEDLFQK